MRIFKNQGKLFFIFSIIFFMFAAGNAFAAGSGENGAENLLRQPDNEAAVQEITRAERIMKALAEAYPRQIDKVEFRNNDWAVFLRGTWFYFCEGRLLPENLLEDIEKYSRQSFYNYPVELPEWVEASPEAVSRFREWDSNRTRSPLRRSTQFYDDLWRVHNRDESYQRLQTFHFLGRTVLVHYLILENMSLVEEHILAAAKTDSRIQTWITGIDTMEAWTWRNIASSQNRSFHSYGLAIDILPKSFGGKETYWLWAANRGADWWSISYNNRFHPPAEVIKAFEKFGFVWGGKWPQFDTMHFEYRPEILIFNGIQPETRR